MKTIQQHLEVKKKHLRIFLTYLKDQNLTYTERKIGEINLQNLIEEIKRIEENISKLNKV